MTPRVVGHTSGAHPTTRSTTSTLWGMAKHNRRITCVWPAHCSGSNMNANTRGMGGSGTQRDPRPIQRGRRLRGVVRIAIIARVGVGDGAHHPNLRPQPHPIGPYGTRLAHHTRLTRLALCLRQAHVARQPIRIPYRQHAHGAHAGVHRVQQPVQRTPPAPRVGDGNDKHVDAGHTRRQPSWIGRVQGHHPMRRVIIGPHALISARVDQRFQRFRRQHRRLGTATDQHQQHVGAYRVRAMLFGARPHATPVRAQPGAGY